MSTVAPVPAPVEDKPLSQPVRIANVFFAPSKTFTDLKRGAAWWMAWLLMAIVSIGFVYTVDAKVGFERALENEMRLAPKQAQLFDSIPEAQRTKQWNTAVQRTRWAAYSSPIIVLLGAMIIAGIMLGTFNFGFGQQLTFGKTLAVVIYSSLPGLITSLIGIAGLYAGANPDGFIMENPAATNLGLIFDPLQSPVLYRFASHFDIITIWTIILIGIGLSCVGNKLKKSTAITVVFSWWFLYVLLGLAKNALTA